VTAEQKKALADFLDVSKAFVSSRYDFQPAQYEFEDDIEDDIEEPTAAAESPSAGSAVECPVLPAQERRDFKAELNTIAQEVRACTGCRLCEKRKNAVPGEGVPRPLVLVLGEGPGADEDASGRPFVGRAGQLLDKMLAAISLSRRTNCFIANIVKCRPPGNRDPAPDEETACFPFLERQIEVLKPKMILAVGRIAAQWMLHTTDPIGRIRGRWLSYQGIPFMVTYHPSALLRNEDLKKPAWEDLKLFRNKLKEAAPDYDAR
jgi:DNA polymerase